MPPLYQGGMTAHLPSSYSSAATRRVLVVADDSRLRDTLLRGLYRHGFDVVAVSTGNELDKIVASLAASEPPESDVVLVDVPNGPDVVALNTLQRLRAKGVALSIICLASASDARAVSAAADLRVATVLVKPIDLNELAAELRRAAREAAQAST